MNQVQQEPRIIPRDSSWDGTLALKREGYDFIRHRCQALDTDIFETRLMLRPTLCLSGSEAARVFYDQRLFQREGAAPQRLKKTLFGVGGVQGLDDEAHRHRKAMIMSLMTAESVNQLVELTRSCWLSAIVDWSEQNDIILKDKVAVVLCQAVCEWAGLSLPKAEVGTRTRQLLNLIEGAGQIGPSHWQSRKTRTHLESWCKAQIKREQEEPDQTRQGTALQVIAQHKEADGSALAPEVGAVELLNILRPTVAISYYIVFCALALHQFPRETERLVSPEAIGRFVQEVRRYYPFFPAVMAKARKTFHWNGYQFPKNRRVLLDLYGTNHDKRLWQKPEEFWPDRFIEAESDQFNLIPQGGGEASTHHRCAGESVTIEIMKLAIELLIERMDYTIPEQDLRLSYKQMPTLPNSGFVMHVSSPLP